jgi:hypothetical protein
MSESGFSVDRVINAFEGIAKIENDLASQGVTSSGICLSLKGDFGESEHPELNPEDLAETLLRSMKKNFHLAYSDDGLDLS